MPKAEITRFFVYKNKVLRSKAPIEYLSMHNFNRFWEVFSSARFQFDELCFVYIESRNIQDCAPTMFKALEWLHTFVTSMLSS